MNGIPPFCVGYEQPIFNRTNAYEQTRARLPTSELRSNASDRFLKLIERKRKREDNVVTAPGKRKRKAEVVDLLEVLRQSLGQSSKASQRRAKR